MGDDKIVDKRMAMTACLWKLAEDESEANHGYAEALAKHTWSNEITEMIKEHMADETQHNEELIKAAIKLSKIDAAED